MTTNDQSIPSQAGKVSEISSEISTELPLGEMIRRANKLLSASNNRMPRRFDFEWQNIVFTVTPEQPDATMTVVVIEACLGRLPFTAQDAAARSGALRMAHPGPDDVPGRLKIDQTGNVHLVMRSEPIPADGLAGLLKEVTWRVLEKASQLSQLRGLLVD